MENRIITVKGIGKVSATPDLLVIEMNLEVTEPEDIDMSDTATVIWAIE